MKHYIIVKFNEGYDYKKEIDNIKKLFDESLKLEGVSKVDIYINRTQKEIIDMT